MSYLLLTIHAYWIDRKLKKFKKEKANSLEDDLKRKRIRRRKKWFGIVGRFLGKHTTINAFCRAIYTEGTFANYVVKSFLGFVGGFFLTYIFFIFFVVQLNFSFTSATVLASTFGVVLTLGLAFSYSVRCLVFLLLPQFFSKRGRQSLIAYAFILTLTGPTKNILHNIGVMSESLACGQEQLKAAVKQIVDLVKKPFHAIRDAIKKIVEVVKKIVVKVKNAFLALQRVIMNILQVVKAAFQWLASIVNICNKKLGTPFQRCMSVFESAVEDCQAKLGPMFSWLCSIAYLVSSVCYLVKFLDYICMLLDFLSDSVVGKVTKKFKEFMNHIRTMFYVSVQFSHSFQFETNQSKALNEVTAGIVTEVRQRTDVFLALFDWMSFLTSFFFIFMILKAINYRHKYLTIDRFDNKYVTEDVRDIDLQRGKLNKETIFPLTRTEKHKFVTLTSIFLVLDERTKLAKTLFFLAHVTFKLFCQVFADYCLYWLLGTIRYYGRMQTGMRAPSTVGVNIIGLGLIADLYKGIINAFTPFVNKFNLDPAPCLPDPLPPDIDRYIQITSLVVICWMLAIFEPYGLRLRQVVMRQYHPDRAKQRAVWLYNHILRSRGNFLKFTRRKLRTLHSKGKSGVEHVSFKQWIRDKTVHIYICRKLLGETNEVTCILCGTPQRHSGDKPFIRCVNYGCVGVYCEECYNQLQNKCTICQDPISYGDLSDVSEEMDSSDDSQESTPHNVIRKTKKYRRSAVSSSSSETSETEYSYQHLKVPDTPESIDYMTKPHFRDLEAQPVKDYATMQVFHNDAYTDSDSFSSRYTRNVPEYDLIVPRKVSINGAFVSHYLPHYYNLERARKKRETNNDPVLHYRLPISGVERHLELWPNHKFINPGMVIETRPNRKVTSFKIEAPGNRQCHFQGHIRGVPFSSVALSTCSGLAGVIKTRDGDYFIEPVENSEPDKIRGHPHIIYKRETSTLDSDTCHSNCGTTGSWSQAWTDRVKWQYKHRRMANYRKRRGEIPSLIKNERSDGTSELSNNTKVQRSYNMEALVVADYNMMLAHKDDDVVTFILTVMNMVSSNVNDASIGNDIAVVVVRIIILKDEIPELMMTNWNDSHIFLANFCKWQQNINPKREDHPNHHDIAILLTKYSICLHPDPSCNKLGMAYLGGICRPDRSCNVNEDDGLRLGFTITHEIGHTLGAEHDEGENGKCSAVDADNTRSFMGPVINMGVSKWSKCSKIAITEFLRTEIGDCMADEPTEFDFRLPIMPAGALYDTNYQCKAQFQVNAVACNVGEFCKALYCQVTPYMCVSTGEPPADGTFCGLNMWCYRGNCVTKGRRPGAVNGEWSDWSPWSECSRTCGVGISGSNRRCNNPLPRNGGRSCIGSKRRYRTCNVVPCHDSGKGFQDIQCSDTNDRPFRGQLWSWRAFRSSFMYTECALICINEVGVAAVRNSIVIDGTPCKPGTRNLCIAGVCRELGCDDVIESGAREDGCGVCHGNGTECEVISNTFSQAEGQANTFIDELPIGAGMITVEEINPSKCSLAVSSKDNSTFYLNGKKHISLSGEIMFGENPGVYERREQKEKIFIRGPLKQSLNLYLIFKDKNPGIQYRYALKKKQIDPFYKPRYRWEFLDWGLCSDPCGGGSQLAKPSCAEEKGGLVEDSYCEETDRPEDMTRNCNEHPCPATWWIGAWENCICNGTEGQTSRAVYCSRYRIKDYTEMQIVPANECSGTKPKTERICNETTLPGCATKANNKSNISRPPEFNPGTKRDAKRQKMHSYNFNKDKESIYNRGRRQNDNTDDDEDIGKNGAYGNPYKSERQAQEPESNASIESSKSSAAAEGRNGIRDVTSVRSDTTECIELSTQRNSESVINNIGKVTDAPNSQIAAVSTFHKGKANSDSTNIDLEIDESLNADSRKDKKITIDKLDSEGLKLFVIHLNKLTNKLLPSQNDEAFQTLGLGGRVGNSINQTILYGKEAIELLKFIKRNATTETPIENSDT